MLIVDYVNYIDVHPSRTPRVGGQRLPICLLQMVGLDGELGSQPAGTPLPLRDIYVFGFPPES
jgi:hypothetical protein